MFLPLAGLDEVHMAGFRVDQVLDSVASRSTEAADILRKQGIADAVIACIDCPKTEVEGDKGR